MPLLQLKEIYTPLRLFGLSVGKMVRRISRLEKDLLKECLLSHLVQMLFLFRGINNDSSVYPLIEVVSRLKVFVVFIYIGMLIIFTCTESLFLLITEQKLHFHFNRHPNLADFFMNDLGSLNDITYVIQKLGHFIFFFFLAMLLYWALRRWILVILISFGLAFLTEVAQLYFSRSGRLLDVLYDMAGLMVFVVFVFGYRFIEWIFSRVFISEVRRHQVMDYTNAFFFCVLQKSSIYLNL